MWFVLSVCNLAIYSVRSATTYSLIVLALTGTQREGSTTRQPLARTSRSLAVSRVCDRVNASPGAKSVAYNENTPIDKNKNLQTILFRIKQNLISRVHDRMMRQEKAR